MKKKLDTRFPAARIKKIMQADEDVGKIAMAVPVLVSKALELFLQDLCDRTYDVTLQRGAKTMSSQHLKHCVQSYNVFDFLRDVVSKVPDYGQSEAVGEERTVSRRRKAAGDELNDSDEESKSRRVNETGNASSSGRGRGRGRGRGKGKVTAKDHDNVTEPDSSLTFQNVAKQQPSSPTRKADPVQEKPKEIRNDGSSTVNSSSLLDIDLNADVQENNPEQKLPSSSRTPEAKVVVNCGEEFPGWSTSEMERIAIDPIHFANMNSRLEEEDEDYDEDG